jgi:DNA modification methylase
MTDKVATLDLRRLALADLKPHPRNPRRHPKAGSPKWDALKTSLAADYFDPLVWNERNGYLVSGHFRTPVLGSLGFTHADVSVVSYDEATHLARMIAANTLLGAWEVDLLDSLARDLEAAGTNAGLAGLTAKEFAELLGGPEVPDDSAEAGLLVSQAAEIQREWQVAPGDLYAIGRHRVMCGSCHDDGVWGALLGGERIDLVWTDPPYNVDYADLMNDRMPEKDYLAFLGRAFAAAFARAKPGCAIYVAHADGHGLANRQAFEGAGWRLAQCLVWVKGSFVLGRQDYQWQHEPILYGWRPDGPHYWQGGYDQATVIDDEKIVLGKASKADLIAIINRLRNSRETTIVREARPVANDLHPTIKPLPLVARHLWNSSRPSEIVADLFCGSGTTILAAEKTGRRAVAVDLDPKYVAVTLERGRRHGLPVTKLRQGYEAAA